MCQTSISPVSSRQPWVFPRSKTAREAPATRPQAARITLESRKSLTCPGANRPHVLLVLIEPSLKLLRREEARLRQCRPLRPNLTRDEEQQLRLLLGRQRGSGGFDFSQSAHIFNLPALARLGKPAFQTSISPLISRGSSRSRAARSFWFSRWRTRSCNHAM